MTKKEVFICDICGTNYSKEKQALDCEKTHYKCTEIIKAKYEPNCYYPDEIKVKFSNNISGRYRRISVINDE